MFRIELKKEERLTGIEPVSSAWKAEVIAIIPQTPGALSNTDIYSENRDKRQGGFHKFLPLYPGEQISYSCG